MSQASEAPIGSQSQSNERNLQSMLDRAVEMSAGGRIDSNSAWQLPLLSYLPNLVQLVDDAGTFAKAAGALGASADLYGKRVDLLHTTIQETMFKKGPEPSNAGAHALHLANAVSTVTDVGANSSLLPL